MVRITSDNNYATNKFIVSSIPSEGNYSTIASALAAASAGDTIFLKPGTYAENISMIAGVNIASDTVGSAGEDVIISGTVTCNYSGSCSFSGITFQTNGADAINSSSGSAVLEIINCSFSCYDYAYCITSSNGSFKLVCNYCLASSSNASYTLFNISSMNSARFVNCDFGNLGIAVTAQSLLASSRMKIESSIWSFPIKTSGTGEVKFENSTFDTASANTVCIQISSGATGATNVDNAILTSGTASGLKQASGTVLNVHNVVFYNSNSKDITT